MNQDKIQPIVARRDGGENIFKATVKTLNFRIMLLGLIFAFCDYFEQIFSENANNSEGWYEYLLQLLGLFVVKSTRIIARQYFLFISMLRVIDISLENDSVLALLKQLYRMLK